MLDFKLVIYIFPLAFVRYKVEYLTLLRQRVMQNICIIDQ